MRSVNNTAQHTTCESKNTSFEPPPVTQKELEAAGQQCLRFRPYSLQEERSAVDWWAMKILHAEQAAKNPENPEAKERPGKYVEGLKFRLLNNEAVLLRVVEEWQEAKITATLDEPVWSAPAATIPTKTLVARRVLTTVTAA